MADLKTHEQVLYSDVRDKLVGAIKKGSLVAWFVADLALAARNSIGQWRELFAEVQAETGFASSTLQGWANVASQWPKEKRNMDVIFSIHEILGSTPNRFELIKRAVKEGWKQDDARVAIGRAPTTIKRGRAMGRPGTSDWYWMEVAAALLHALKQGGKDADAAMANPREYADTLMRKGKLTDLRMELLNHMIAVGPHNSHEIPNVGAMSAAEAARVTSG